MNYTKNYPLRSLKKAYTFLVVVCLSLFINQIYVYASSSASYVVEPDIVVGDLYYTLENNVLTIYSLNGNYGSKDGSYVDTSSIFYEYRDQIKKIVLSDTITYIASQSFDSLPSGMTISLPKTLNEIDGYAFARCSSLNIELDSKNPYFKLVNGILYTYDMTELVYASSTLTGDFTVPSSVKTVRDGAFVFSNFKNITIPDTVTCMMTNAYGDDPNWGLCGRVFANALCETITIGKNVEMLGRCAFFRCPNLKSITILGKDTYFEDDFVIDDEGSNIGVVYVPHNSHAEEYMKTHYANNWDYLASDSSLTDILTSTTYTTDNSQLVFTISTDLPITNEFLGIALYSSSGNLISISNDYELGTSNSQYVIKTPANPKASHAKVFLWNSLSSMSALGLSENLSITYSN